MIPIVGSWMAEDGGDRPVNFAEDGSVEWRLPEGADFDSEECDSASFNFTLLQSDAGSGSKVESW